MKQANNHMNALEMLISNISSRISSATDQKVKLTLTKLVNRISVQEVLSSDNLKNIQKLLVNINDDLLDELDTDEQRVQYKKYFDAIFYRS